MGYYTDYEVQISGFKNRDEAEFFEFKEFHKDDGLLNDIKSSTSMYVESHSVSFRLGQWKWYNWQKDLEALSKKYPHLTFEVNGVGEEFPDIWKARVRNGETEVVEAQIIFPNFEKIC